MENGFSHLWLRACAVAATTVEFCYGCYCIQSNILEQRLWIFAISITTFRFSFSQLPVDNQKPDRKRESAKRQAYAFVWCIFCYSGPFQSVTIVNYVFSFIVTLWIVCFRWFLWFFHKKKWTILQIYFKTF